jgi:hypothetical protein
MNEMPGDQGEKDDLSIPNETVLWRRIRKDDVLPDGSRPKKSPCFEDSKDSPMSVTITDDLDISPEEYLSQYPEEGLVSITVAQIREKGLGITREPTETDPGHAFVHGKKTGSIKKKLANECEWVIKP